MSHCMYMADDMDLSELGETAATATSRPSSPRYLKDFA